MMMYTTELICLVTRCEITGGVLSSADVYNRTDLSSNQQRMSAEVADALVKVRFPYLQMKHEDLR